MSPNRCIAAAWGLFSIGRFIAATFLQQRFGAVGMEHFIMFKVKVENIGIRQVSVFLRVKSIRRFEFHNVF